MYLEGVSGVLGVQIPGQRTVPISIYLQFQSCPLATQQNPSFPICFQIQFTLSPSFSSFQRNKLQLFPLVLKPIAQKTAAHIRTRSSLPAGCSLESL